ncbi:hypothetical protein RB597_001468 [Gaeumannomyces tritici]
MSFHYQTTYSPPSSSGAATPTTTTSGGSSNYFGSGLYSAFGGLIRRLSSEPNGSMTSHNHHNHHRYDDDDDDDGDQKGVNGVYNPRGRKASRAPRRRSPSPLQPPPLSPLVLRGFRDDTPASARLLTGPVAEEIRIMVPERLRIEEDWKLVYSLDQDGASLATLYEKSAEYRGRRGGFVLVVRDDEGETFGAYLSEAPHISAHYFGTGECFLWRASVMASLPPPPSADTTNLTGRTTTVPAAAPPKLVPIYDTDLETHGTSEYHLHADDEPGAGHGRNHGLLTPPQPPASPSIRFKAFPYSGVNEYYVYCEPLWLSVGGGDGKYGLWLDDSLEKGVSGRSLTFGNEPLSDQGDKFGVLGVELWIIGAKD